MFKIFQIAILLLIYIFSFGLKDLSLIFTSFLLFYVLYYIITESNYSNGLLIYSLIFLFFETSFYIYKLIPTEDKNEPLIDSDPSKFNMLYLETNTSNDFLSLREMCSLESAAFRNPNANVYLFSLKAKIDSNLLEEYKNIRLILTTPEEIYNNTPLDEWYKRDKEKLYKGPYFVHDLSDTMRLALVYKYGGYYSDLDVLSIKSLKPLQDIDAFGLEYNKNSTNNAVFMFKKKHPFLKAAFEELKNDYRTGSWAYNGPLLIMRTLRKYCKTENIYQELKLEEDFELKKGYTKNTKCDVNMLPGKYFYSLGWDNIGLAFKPNGTFDISLYTNSYAIHFFNQISRTYNVKLNDFTIYEYFASQSCPYTYRYFKLNPNLNF